MEIQRLQLLVTEQDLQDLAREHIPQDAALDDLDIRVHQEGLHVKGVYQMFVPVSFDALWELGVQDGRPTARLAKFRTMGMPANVLKSLIINVVADASKNLPWLNVKEDVIQLDLEDWLHRQGINLVVHLQGIRCEPGRLIIEGGHAIGLSATGG
jgi:hypothetical protein